MNMFDKLIGVLAPHSCINCDREGELICAWCAADIFPGLPSKCYRCAALTEDFRVCAKCRPRTRLKHVWLRTNYDQLAKQLIHQYKFVHARAAAVDIARQMAQGLPYLTDTVLVPVPTASRRVRQRGFDHTRLLVDELASALGLTTDNALSRVGQSRQVGTKRVQRIKQAAGMFRVIGDVSGQKLLLIDDVVTTGATIEEAARVLKQAGAKQVDAAIFAQAK